MTRTEKTSLTTIRDTLDAAWDGDEMEYDLNGVIQAHKGLKQLMADEAARPERKKPAQQSEQQAS